MPRRRSSSIRGSHSSQAGPTFGASDPNPQTVLDALPAIVGYWDRSLHNRMGNQAYVDFFGVTPDKLHGMHIRDLLGLELYEKNLPYMLKALAGEAQLFDRMIVDSSGRVRHTQASYIPDMVDGKARGFFVLVTDITERRRAEEALAAAEQRFRTLFDMAPLGTFLASPQKVVLDANAAAVKLLGRSREALLGRSMHSFTHPADLDISQARLSALLAGEINTYTIEKRYIRGDGDIIWLQLDARLLRDGPYGAMSILGQIQDISQRRSQQAELERIAHHDPLTGLLNRRGLLVELEQSCALMRRYGDGSALLILDLDHFKAVNDTYGHEAGDQVLREVGLLLAARLRETDIIARHGGDEFAVILPHSSLADARLVGAALVAQIRTARLGVRERPISVSAGAALLQADDTAAKVLARADLAMYDAKSAGGDAVALSPPGGEAATPATRTDCK